MFKKNISALKNNNPALAEKLLKTIHKDIEVYQSDNQDLNIAYKNVLIHDSIDPTQEAKQLFNNASTDNTLNSFFVVIGLGLGYLFKRSYISTNNRIILFEPNIDILRFTLEYVDFSQELSDKRVYVCTNINEVINTLNRRFILGDKIELACLPSYAQINTNEINELSKTIVSLIDSKKVDQGTTLNNALWWGQKSLKNLDYIQKALPVSILLDKYSDKTVVIVSAGPSLEENIELIKQNRDKFILLTINSALRALLTHDIIPDFCVISEIGGIDTQFQGLEKLNKVKFILHPRTQQSIWELSDYPNLVYFAESDGFSNWYHKKYAETFDLYKTAGTVSILAFYVATQIIKSKKILLIGQDLSLVNNQMYSSSCLKEGESISINNDVINCEKTDEKTKEFFKKIQLIKITNNQNEEIYTRKDYFEYIKQYEDIIKNELSDDIIIINTSEKGAFIDGTQHLSLKKALSDIKTIDSSLFNLINKELEDLKPSIDINKNKYEPNFSTFNNDIKKYQKICHNLISIIEKFKLLFSKSPNNSELNKIIQDFYSQKKPLFDFIQEEEVIFFMLQKYFLNYAQNYIIQEQGKILNINEHAQNFNLELKLLKYIQQVLQWDTTLTPYTISDIDHNKA